MPMQMINGAMEVIHDQSLPTIELLQLSFPDNKDLMINISTLFDPRYVFLIYAPILFALNKRVGHRMIMALTLTEWANQILKWLLAGERPYWYVQERRFELANLTAPGQLERLGAQLPARALAAGYLAPSPSQPQPPAHYAPALPELKQFPVTCELGAGSPSGHAMVTATVWYILIDAYLKGELRPLAKADYSRLGAGLDGYCGRTLDKLAKLSWSVYTLMLVLVSLSRVYLACHFPHQCLCGALLGLAVGRLVVERAPVERLRRRHFALLSLAMFASAMATYSLLKSLGVNPLWSVDKAMRWCDKKEYIHLDTTPFFSMMRYLGFCLGAGLAYDRSRAALTSGRAECCAGNLLARRTLAAAGSVAFGQLLMALPMPKQNLHLFYLISFLIYTAFSYAIAAPIPALAKRALAASNGRDGAKAKAH